MAKNRFGIGSRLLPLVFVSAVGISQSALAAPCSEQVNALQAALDNGICIYSKSCSGLSSKLDNANKKLEKGRFDDAARKLADFGSVLETLATHGKKPKISMADYQFLMSNYFNDAANCIANGGVIEVEEPAPEPTEPVANPFDNIPI